METKNRKTEIADLVSQMAWNSEDLAHEYYALMAGASLPDVYITKKGVLHNYKSLIGGHVHHVLPRSLGGVNEINNLVDLSYEDHLRAHYLLAKGEVSPKMDGAFRYMVDIGNSAGEIGELTEDMLKQYRISSEVSKRAVSDRASKPVMAVRNYIDNDPLIFKNVGEAAGHFGLNYETLIERLRRSKDQIERNGKPTPSSAPDRYIIVYAELDWAAEYLRLGHAPNINKKFIGSLSGDKEKKARANRKKAREVSPKLREII